MLKHSKSKKAFEHNVKTEMNEGKPQNQSLAIAYSVKRKAGPKKMAEGGLAQFLDEAADRISGQKPPKPADHPEQTTIKGDPSQKRNPMTGEKPTPRYASGGLVDEKHLMDLYPQDETEHFDSITDAIRHKMNLKKMAEGGMVDIEENNEEQPNAYYDADEAALKENYEQDFEDMSQPMDSNEHGDAREDATEDKHDMISAIRNKMKKMR